jgi:hypothetical protein
MVNAATGAVGAIANAATRSALTGTSFGDNILAAIPDVIGQTIGNMVAMGVSAEPPRASGATRVDDASSRALDPRALAGAGFDIGEFDLSVNLPAFQLEPLGTATTEGVATADQARAATTDGAAAADAGPVETAADGAAAGGISSSQGGRNADPVADGQEIVVTASRRRTRDVRLNSHGSYAGQEKSADATSLSFLSDLGWGKYERRLVRDVGVAFAREYLGVDEAYDALGRDLVARSREGDLLGFKLRAARSALATFAENEELAAGYGRAIAIVDEELVAITLQADRRLNVELKAFGREYVNIASTLPTPIGGIANSVRVLDGVYSAELTPAEAAMEMVPGRLGRAERLLQGFGRTSLNAGDVRFSQEWVSSKTRDGIPLPDLTKNMRNNGWRGDPIDVVRMPDGGLTSVDNRRLVAAREAGIRVEANVRGFDDPLTPQESRRLSSRGSVPKTWGEAVTLRIQRQPNGFPAASPYGSHVVPRINYK